LTGPEDAEKFFTSMKKWVIQSKTNNRKKTTWNKCKVNAINIILFERVNIFGKLKAHNLEIKYLRSLQSN